MTTSTTKQPRRDEALTRLRNLLPPGTTVYTTVKHVSRSGMHRLISAYVVHDGAPQWLDGYIDSAGVFTCDRKRSGLRVGGCGMDAGFHVVYELGQVLYPGGFGCIGRKQESANEKWAPELYKTQWINVCPSNDHSNGDRDYTPHDSETTVRGVFAGVKGKAVHWHLDGGYALRRKWL